MARHLHGAEIWRWRHVAKVHKRGGMRALRRMQHLDKGVRTNVAIGLPAVRRAIEASRNAGKSVSGQNSQTSQRTSSGGEHA